MTDKTRNDDMTDVLAGEYVLGTLLGDSRRRFEERMAEDPLAADAVAAWQQRFSSLLETADDKELPDHLWSAIEARLDDDPNITEVTTVRADEGVWQPLAPGVDMKVLYLDTEQNMRSVLVRLAAGSHFPAHDHPSDEECIMLHGDLTFGDLKLRAGDYHRMPRGVSHPEGVSNEGALVYVRAQIA